MTARRYPQLLLDRDALGANIALMAGWCADRGVELRPHAKTTMCRPIVSRQLAAGATGVTVATVNQAAVARTWGMRSILIANEIVDPRELDWLRATLEQDVGLQVWCFVDSVRAAQLADAAFQHTDSRLRILVDVGTPGGRTGVRDYGEAQAVALHVAAAPGLSLEGVGGYEGVVANRRDAATLAAVDDHCRRVRDIFHRLATLYETPKPIYTMGGSAFPDRVISHLPATAVVPGVTVVLRSGCYVTHDHGTYAQVSPIPGLTAALRVRTAVLSTPETGFAVLGAGKRELPHDAGLPMLIGVRDAEGTAKTIFGGSVHEMFDHHTTLIDAHGLVPGDVVDLGISHPCSSFSRFRTFLVSSGGSIVDEWTTEFP